MFGLSWAEVLTLAFIALIVLGPERLPKYAAEAGRLLRQLRSMAKDASQDLRKELGDDMPDLKLSDLANPKAAVARYLLEAGVSPAEIAAAVKATPDEPRPRAAAPAGSGAATGAASPAAYDVDAT